MNIKNGLSEIFVTALCCAIYALVGLPWASGLILAAGLLGVFAIAALAMNYASLPPSYRSPLLSCVIAPFSTLQRIMPIAIMLPGLERLKEDLREKP